MWASTSWWKRKSGKRGSGVRGKDERSKEVNCPEIFNPVERPRDPLLARRVSNGQDKFPIGSMANRVKRFSRLVILCFHPRSTDVDAVTLGLFLGFSSFSFLSWAGRSTLYHISYSTIPISGLLKSDYTNVGDSDVEFEFLELCMQLCKGSFCHS